jgi:hypothetical protein
LGARRAGFEAEVLVFRELQFAAILRRERWLSGADLTD